MSTFADADRPRPIRHYTDGIDRWHNLSLPREPLSRERVEQWAARLNASEAQIHHMEREYRAFVDRYNEFMDRDAPRQVAMCAELAELVLSEGLDSPAFVELSRKVDRENLRMRRQMTAIELSFLDALEPMLTDEQLELMFVMRNEILRRNCRTSFSHARWFYIELRPIWAASAALDASDEEAERAERILDEYEAQLTSLVFAEAEHRFVRRERLTRNRIATNTGTVDPQEGWARYRQIMRQRADRVRRIRLLHEQTLERMTGALREEVAARFLAEVGRVVFPELYPDATAIHDVFNAVIADEEIDDKHRSLAGALLQAYEFAYDRANIELEAFCIEWGEQNAEGVDGYQMQFLPGALAPLLEKRTALSRDWLERLELAVGAEAIARHGELIPPGLRDDEPAP